MQAEGISVTERLAQPRRPPTSASYTLTPNPTHLLPLTPYPLLAATAGFVFSYVDHAVANLAESKDNGLAGAAGGCAAGFVSGVRTGSLPKAMGMCAFMGAAVGTYDLAGGQLGWESGRKSRAEREEDRLSFFKKKEEATD